VHQTGRLGSKNATTVAATEGGKKFIRRRRRWNRKTYSQLKKTTGTGDTYNTLTSTTVKKKSRRIHPLFVSKRGERNIMRSISTFVCFERRFVKKL